MKHRVICIMGRVLDQDDGLGVYAENLLRHLFELDRDSRYVVLLRTKKHRDLFSTYSNVESQVLPAKIKTMWDQVTVPVAARRAGADIIFNPKFSLPFLSGIPGVFVLHGSDWYVNPQNYEWWDNIYIRLMMPIYCRKAKRLMAISQTIADDLVRYAHVDPNKITVSYAAPGDHFTPYSDPQRLTEFANRYHLPPRFIFSVARAYHTGHGKLPPYPGGNIEGLVRGYQGYRKQGGELPLVIAGDRIRDYLESNGFNEKDQEGIQFLGFVPHTEINLAYNLAEFFVLTTLYESFAFPLVEAMASGCPAIVPSTGACPEVAGEAACLVDPRNHNEISKSIAELSNSRERRTSLRKLAIQRVMEFNWTKTAERTLGVFNEITYGI